MQRVASVLARAVQSGTPAASTSEAVRGFASAANFAFSGVQDAPAPSGSSQIKLSVSQTDAKGKKRVAVTASAGKAAVKAEYDASSLRALSATPLALADAARVSVLHSSLQECLLRLAHERYSLLAQWPDFTKLYGADYYYRAHPEDLRKFYALVDEFHRMWDVVTEFDSLSGLAQQLVPAARRKRLNVIHPAVGPTSANGAVAAFLLAHAK